MSPKIVPVEMIGSKPKRLYERVFRKLDYFVAFNLPDGILPSHVENEQMETILTIDISDQSITKKTKRKKLK